jgi:hypothetical protein
MDRRTFLKTLAALGAAIPLPVASLAEATTSEVNAAWTETTKTWGLFEVNEYGTLSFANFEEPKTHADAYDLPPPEEITVADIEGCQPLANHIGNLYFDAAEAAADSPSASGDRLDEGWEVWFEHATPETRVRLVAAIEEWLDDGIDWVREDEYIYSTGTGQGAAYRYFLNADLEVLDALSIVVIEGEHPGSSYYAAELHMDPDEANEIARREGFGLRFVREGAV